jgi:zinc transport system substrate-binding protein
MIQARNILSGLVAVDPAHKTVYEANYKKFIVELVDLDAEIRGVFAKKGKGLEFMVFHPAWGYFAGAYGLKQVPVEIDGKTPKPVDLQRLIHLAKERDIKVVFTQPQFSSKHAQVIADAIGGQIVFINPLAPDWSDNLRRIAAKFKAALR